jgi:predicted RNase H-like nuclease (RuvC/YqgF family)
VQRLRLDQTKTHKRQKCAEETEEEREARLYRISKTRGRSFRMRQKKSSCMARVQRGQRKTEMSANQRARLRNETGEERQARLEQRRCGGDITLLQHAQCK